MTAEEYIKTLPDVDLIFAYISCVISENVEGTEDMDVDINNDEYEDVKVQVDKLVEQARDRAFVPYKIETKSDLMKYFDEVYGEFIDNDPDIREYKKVWMIDPWKEFIGIIDEMKDYYKDSKWYEYGGYYFTTGIW